MNITLEYEYRAVDRADKEIDLQDISNYVSEYIDKDIELTEDHMYNWVDSGYMYVDYCDNYKLNCRIGELINDYLIINLQNDLERIWEDHIETNFEVG